MASSYTTLSARSFISRSWSRSSDRSRASQASASSEPPKGPLGLTTLYQPSQDRPVVADLIFVHGLNGGSYSTWTKGGDPARFWPREWLPGDKPMDNVRMHTFGYPSGISKESVLNVRDFARSLLAAIQDSHILLQDAKIIFVAHSMGGLVVKMASVLSRHDPMLVDIFNRITAILFLATPHQGAAIAQTLNRLLAVMSGSRPFVDDLLPHSPMLQAINEDFPLVASDMQLMSFFETRPMMLDIGRMLVVEKHCAVMNMPNERRQLLDADHRNVAMFSSPQNSCYAVVKNALISLFQSLHDRSVPIRGPIVPQTHQSPVVDGPRDTRNLASYLGISDTLEDDIAIQDSRRTPGSCQWLLRRASYTAWADGQSSGTLWIQGRPGAGKSVLSGHVVSELRKKGQECCYYFFQSGDSIRSSVGTFLRYLAFQMAQIHPEIADTIGKAFLSAGDTTLDSAEHQIVWRKLFDYILKVEVTKAQFWVIDAIEECPGSADVMMYLAKMQHRWPIRLFVTSRNTEDAHLPKPMVRFQRDDISQYDSLQDIGLYLSSMRDSLPSVPSSNWKDRSEMAAYIMQRSEGCFLWVRLVCNELREASRLSEIEDILQNTPSNMDHLYSAILENMDQAQFGRSVARATLLWASHSFRPLASAEIREAVEATVQDKIDEDVERFIASSCGNLVFVDAQQHVRLLHSTVREFLTRPTTVSTFSVTEADAHAQIATICLEHLSTIQDRRAGKLRRGLSEHSSQCTKANKSESLFTSYASDYAFQHLNHVSPRNDQIMSTLVNFLSSASVLSWIEYVAAHGDLQTVFQAGRSLNSFLTRRPRHLSSTGLSQNQLELLDHWGHDLIHLVTKFSRWLKLVPRSMHHLIPAFCPDHSAFRRQFVSPFRGIYVEGLSTSRWDDCLATIPYSRDTRPNVLASGGGFFAVGTLTGRILVYDDVMFQEAHAFQHEGPVWRLAVSTRSKKLAAAAQENIRIWCLDEGTEQANFHIPAFCLSLAFVQDDSILLATTRSNTMLAWEVAANKWLGEPMDWTVDFESEAPEIYLRVPSIIVGADSIDSLAIVHRHHDIVFWNYEEDRIHDFYNKYLGSRLVNGPKTRPMIDPDVRAIAVSSSPDRNRLAATYIDGDLVSFDLDTGKQLALSSAANKSLLAASDDGRTLLGADSGGNLALFDFDTLRTLYKVRFETCEMVKGLVFTSDNMRFIELRRHQCRVWGPPILSRNSTQDEDNDDGAHLFSASPVEIDYDSRRGIEITSIFCSPAADLVFCGRQDGSILIYDVGGKTYYSQPLQEPHLDFAVRALYYDDAHSILASYDSGCSVKVRNISSKHPAGVGAGDKAAAAWEVGEALTFKTASNTAVVRKILISGGDSRILVSDKEHDTLWALSKESGSAWVSQIPSRGWDRWAAHPTRPGCLVFAADDGIVLYSWDTLAQLTRIRFPEAILSLSYTAVQMVPLPPAHSFAVIMTSSSGKGSRASRQTKRILVYRGTDDTTNNSDTAHPTSKRLIHDLGASNSSLVDFVIGAFGTRLVVYTTDHWVASFGLKHRDNNAGGDDADSLVKHFFIPFHWLSVSGEMLMGIGKNGEILFAKQSELAIIKRGLETTLDGEKFNPRRALQSKV